MNQTLSAAASVARRALVAAAACAAILSAVSCAVQAEGTLGADRRATLTVQTSIHPVLQAYFKDLAGPDADKIIDPARIRARLAEEPGLTVKSLEASLKDGVKMKLEVADLQKLFASRTQAKGVFTLAPEGGKTRLTVKLDRAAVESFLSMGMAADDEGMSYLLPNSKTVTAAKYQENLRWAFEEYGTPKELDDLFKTARIKFQLTVPRPVQSATGFTVVDKAGGVVRLEIGVVDLLTLSGTATYSLLY